MEVKRPIYICSLILIFYFSTVICEIEPRYDEKLQLLATSTKSPEFVSEKPQDRLGFLHAFIASLSVIVVSELGDKTFFIAAIMAMKHPRLTVFAGAISALALMTILSGTINIYINTLFQQFYGNYSLSLSLTSTMLLIFSVTIIGGVVFLVFALTALFVNPVEDV
ncbi:transmembrane protein 165 [Formica exsecta]|uniref:transmembrane protein 165 n=1 Tax=Formica exsecta TaxID=72781 RepID=UPI00114439DB|nr:transmembrane protein 165 [Formica exsecta]